MFGSAVVPQNMLYILVINKDLTRTARLAQWLERVTFIT